MSILLPKGWNIKINWNPQPFLTLCPPSKNGSAGGTRALAHLLQIWWDTSSTRWRSKIVVHEIGYCSSGKWGFQRDPLAFWRDFGGGASSRTFGSTLTGGFGDDHSEANDLCSFTKNPPWPRFGGSHPARWRVWDLPWPALFLWWTLLQKNVWKMGGVFPKGMV